MLFWVCAASGTALDFCAGSAATNVEVISKHSTIPMVNIAFI